jgi:hypothetical protein
MVEISPRTPSVPLQCKPTHIIYGVYVYSILSPILSGSSDVFSQTWFNACTNSILELAQKFFAQTHHYLQDIRIFLMSCGD